MPSIAVLVAMEAELIHLRNFATSSSHRTIGVWDAYDLSINGHEVLTVRSGIGMLNAAASTERVVAEFKPEIILNYGCAGAHRRDIMPGDVIIGSETVNHGALNILRDGTEVHNDRGTIVSGERIFPAVIDADPKLLETAQSVASELTIEPWPEGVVWPSSVPYRNPQVHVGPLASSEIWTQSLDRLDVLHSRHGSLSEDNESGAFAHVAYIHEIPFLSIKDIANNEYHAASDLAEYSDFPTAEVGKRAASLVAALITAL
ncbi:MAG TPA: 5'-methylthioadenosine/S-adenosylhomocysteine nucleosidase [Thermomicrobiales bacterium]|nr:5'-methylthioadenosine/S-adenosylhomocysteine nucleosidase [Thermomicrobiales bacterium]